MRYFSGVFLKKKGMNCVWIRLDRSAHMDRVGCIFPSFPNKIELVGPGCEMAVVFMLGFQILHFLFREGFV